MEPMLGRASIPLLLGVAVLAIGGEAQAATTYDLSVSPNPPNQGEQTTFRLTPSSARDVIVVWDLDGNGRYDAFGRTVTRTYAQPGPVSVAMRVVEGDGDDFLVTKDLRVNGAPVVDFTFSPSSPLAGRQVAFSPVVTDPEGDRVSLVWRFGDGETGSGGAPTHAYQRADTYEATLVATDAHGASRTAVREVTVARDPGPSASFRFAPAAPVTGQVVRFSSTSTPSQGAIVDTDWDLDGDRRFDDATGAEVGWSFAGIGAHTVAVRVKQSNGATAVGFGTVNVGRAPAPPPAFAPPLSGPPDSLGPSAPPAPSPAKRPRPERMRPFPVVRIAGVVLARGARVRILSVRAPRRSHVRVRCRGRGCPAASVARTSATRVVRFRRFERRLRAGVTLELFVSQRGKIGKYTRFRIRAGDVPARVDRCLIPGRRRPARCA